MLVFRFNTREILIIVNICVHISPRLLLFTLSAWWCSSAFRMLGVGREKTTKIFFSKKFTCHCTTLQFAIDSKQSTKQCTHIHRFTHIKHIYIYTHLYVHTFIHSHIKCDYTVLFWVVRVRFLCLSIKGELCLRVHSQASLRLHMTLIHNKEGTLRFVFENNVCGLFECCRGNVSEWFECGSKVEHCV